jgi:predicted RNA polymerase sigma factor
MFNEGYAASAGPALQRNDLATEAIRLARALHAAAPEAAVDGGGEVAGLLALMLLTHARRDARTGPNGELVPLGEQDRRRWDRPMIDEGVALVDRCFGSGPVGEYQLQAAVAALHDLAEDEAATDWAEIDLLYGHLEGLTRNPMVTLNRAVAVAMVDGPQAGLDLLATLDEPLGDHHRLAAVRAHLLERAGDLDGAVAAFRSAAARATSRPEQDYLTTQAARLGQAKRS